MITPIDQRSAEIIARCRAAQEGVTRAVIKFSRTDREILGMLSTGRNSKEIAYELEISPRAVQGRLRRIAHKAGVADSRQLVVFTAQQPACLARDGECVRGLRAA